MKILPVVATAAISYNIPLLFMLSATNGQADLEMSGRVVVVRLSLLSIYQFFCLSIFQSLSIYQSI